MLTVLGYLHSHFTRDCFQLFVQRTSRTLVHDFILLTGLAVD